MECMPPTLHVAQCYLFCEIYVDVMHAVQIVMTATTAVLCFVASPRTPQEHVAAQTVSWHGLPHTKCKCSSTFALLVMQHIPAQTRSIAMSFTFMLQIRTCFVASPPMHIALQHDSCVHIATWQSSCAQLQLVLAYISCISNIRSDPRTTCLCLYIP